MKSRNAKLSCLLAEDPSDDEEDVFSLTAGSLLQGSSSEAWMAEWNKYIDAVDEFGPRITNSVQWWGVSAIIFIPEILSF
jgi:hypothetical protein